MEPNKYRRPCSSIEALLDKYSSTPQSYLGKGQAAKYGTRSFPVLDVVPRLMWTNHGRMAGSRELWPSINLRNRIPSRSSINSEKEYTSAR